MAAYLIDDLDGSEAYESVLFGLDGDQYLIDLSEKNARVLRATLARYVDAGRYVRGYRKRKLALPEVAGDATPSRARHNNEEIRRWARERDLPVSTRGVISHRIMKLYENSHVLSST